MRISMWMLNDWLKKYAPVPRIRQGGRVLQGARLFSDELKISRSTVYLDQIQRDRVLCSGGHDLLLLHADDINAVFNDILDAFDFYNEWGGDAEELARKGCAMEELLDHGAALLGRALIVADATFYMRAIRGPEALLAALPSLGGLDRERMLPLESLLALSAQERIRRADLPSYVVEPPGVRPAAAVTNLFTEGVHKGWLVTVNADGVYSRGDLDRQDAFAEVLTAWMKGSDRGGERMERSGMFLELLDRPDAPTEPIEARLKTFGWYPPDRKKLYVIRRLAPEKDPMDALERYLERLNPYAFLFRREGELLFLTNLQLTPAERYEGELSELLARCESAAGTGPVFASLSRLAECRMAARTALDCAPLVPGQLRPFEDAALPYIAGLLRSHSAFDLRHPAVAALEDYDRGRGRGRARDEGLAQTLRAYLEHNCSCAETAAALFIHRSTLLYRLGRIREMTGVNLEDPAVRLHLLLSFLLSDAGDQE